jgi:AraC-like DNA-binding protein
VNELATRYPSVEVDPNVLYVDTGNVLTSAGAAAGIDLCLHMIRLDHGAAIAAEAARRAVVPLERAGGQAQFIVHEQPASASSLAPLLEWVTAHLNADLRLPALARRAAMSTRTFSRRFREQVGMTPLQWLLNQRVRRAQQLLETSRLSVEQIATKVGFDSASSLRDRFGRVVGTSPQEYRFGARTATARRRRCRLVGRRGATCVDETDAAAIAECFSSGPFEMRVPFGAGSRRAHDRLHELRSAHRRRRDVRSTDARTIRRDRGTRLPGRRQSRARDVRPRDP